MKFASLRYSLPTALLLLSLIFARTVLPAGSANKVAARNSPASRFDGPAELPRV